MSEMLPGLFEELEAPIALEQVVFDYRLLSADKREFVMQKTDETQILLKRTAEYIIQIGHNLEEVSNIMPHGMFLPWLRSEFEMSRQTSDRFRHVAKRFAGKMPNLGNLNFAASALYLLADPNTPQESVDEAIRLSQVEHITHALAKQIIEQQEAIKKAQESEIEAKSQSAILQEQLFQVRQSSLERSDELLSQINELNQQMEDLQKPDTVEIEVLPEAKKMEIERLQREADELNQLLEDEKEAVPPGMRALLTTLQEKNEYLVEEVKAKSANIEKLREDIDTAVLNKELKDSADRLRSQWRLITSEVHSCMMRLLGHFPTPIDLRSFEEEDWERTEQMKETLRRILDECENLHVAPVSSAPYVLRPMAQSEG